MWWQSRLFPVVAFVVASMVFVVSLAHSMLVERVLGAVNETPIFLTDLERDLAFFQESIVGVSLSGLGESETHDVGLEALINKRLLVAEARRLNIPGPAPAVLSDRLTRLRDRLGGAEALTGMMTEHGMNQEDLSSMLREQFLVQRFLEARIFPFVRTAIASSHAKGKRHLLSPEETRRALIRKRLAQYVDRLRARATIQVNANSQ